MNRIILIFLLLFSSVSVGLSQVSSYGIIPYPRSSAMGAGYAGIADDAGSAFFNPAGLALVTGIEGTLAYQRPYGLSFFDDFAGVIALPMDRYGTFALSAQNFSVNYQGNDLSAERVVGLSYGAILHRDIHSSIAMGITAKWLYWKLGDSVPDPSGSSTILGSASTFGLDMGVQASLWQRTRVGAALVNLNSPTMGNPTPHDLPQIFRAGICYEPLDNVSTVIGAERILGQEVELSLGAEAWVFPELALRMGVTSDPNRFTAGIGIHIRQFQLDYAYLTHPELPGTHQVSIGILLPKSFPDIITPASHGGRS